MTFLILSASPEHTECKSFVTVYKPIAGWKAVQYWWNPDMGGFWEPWQTGSFAYATKEEAVEDALCWAEAEEIPFYVEGYSVPTHEPKESPDYDPSQSPRKS